MIKYSHQERFAALNEAMEDGLTIEGDRKTGSNVFTILTQWFRAESIEEAADYMIHYKKFLEMYSYDRHDAFFDLQQKNLIRLRFNAWFDKNERPSEEEEMKAIKEDKIINEKWDKLNEEFAQKLAEELFDTRFELDDENKEIKIRKWEMPDDTIPTAIE